MDGIATAQKYHELFNSWIKITVVWLRYYCYLSLIAKQTQPNIEQCCNASFHIDEIDDHKSGSPQR